MEKIKIHLQQKSSSVSWDDYSKYNGKNNANVPNHQSDSFHKTIIYR
jgi:hypothetical protein